MCLTLPAKVISFSKDSARVKIDGHERDVKCLLQDLRVGDWVLVNADLAVEKISKKEAEDILKLIS